MRSAIAEMVGLEHSPVTILWSDVLPEDAVQFKKGRWGCVMAAFGAVAARGKTAAFSSETYGCPGGGVGLGLGDCYADFLGGHEGFYGFLSSGNETAENGKELCELASRFLHGAQLEHFKHGEHYRKSPAVVRKFVETLPMMQPSAKYLIFKPLAQVAPDERPEVVVFIVNPDQLSALMLLANYESEDSMNAIIPQAAGCQSIGIFTFREARSKRPRAVVGLNDPSARLMLRSLGRDVLTFSVPMALFEQMEINAPGCFLEGGTWRELSVRK